jgi:zinc transporter ZupT
MVIEGQAVLAVLLYTSIAALLAAAGVLPYAVRERIPLAWPGFAYALAAGLMVGVAYVLMVEGLGDGTPWVVLGAGLGVAYTYWTQAYSGSLGLERLPQGEIGAVEGYKIVLQNALHAASEGVAIGAAMALSLRLGGFLAAALALHNVAEGLALAVVLCRRGVSPGHAAGVAVMTKVPQVLLAIVGFVLAGSVPGLLPWILGFAAGTLVFLSITELLPASYRYGRRRAIALAVSISAGAVVLGRSLFF